MEEDDRDETFFVIGVGERKIAKTKAQIVKEYFDGHGGDQLEMWSETLD
jgi:hypothetical protein